MDPDPLFTFTCDRIAWLETREQLSDDDRLMLEAAQSVFREVLEAQCN